MLKNSKLVQWAKKFAPQALDLVGDVTGISALNRLSDIIQYENPDGLAPEQIAEALKSRELDLQELQLLNADRDSARNREIEVAKTSKRDFMMPLTGISGLITFMVMVYAVIFIPSTHTNPLFHQLMGIIEGVTLTIFAYYFGTSKSSADKNTMINGNLLRK